MSQHNSPSGKPLSNYELFLKFKPGSAKKDFTYRGDLTLKFYQERNYPFKSELQALLTKMNNCQNRATKAIIYDNTGDFFRKIVFELDNGAIVTNLLTGENDPEKRGV